MTRTSNTSEEEELPPMPAAPRLRPGKLSSMPAPITVPTEEELQEFFRVFNILVSRFTPDFC
jgi:hypothetical protein